VHGKLIPIYIFFKIVNWLLNNRCQFNIVFTNLLQRHLLFNYPVPAMQQVVSETKSAKIEQSILWPKWINSCLDTLLYLLTDKNLPLYKREILKCSVSKMKSSFLYLVLSFFHLGFAEYEKIVFYQPEQIHLALGGNHKHLFTF
jgi:hypothetical protein